MRVLLRRTEMFSLNTGECACLESMDSKLKSVPEGWAFFVSLFGRASLTLMVAKTAATLEDYLHMTFELDHEFAGGKYVERGSPTRTHCDLQFFFTAFFRSLRNSGLYAYSELRVRFSMEL